MTILVNAKEERLTIVSASYRALSNPNWKSERRSVFIKPNIWETSKTANTHPEIVKWIVHYLKTWN